MRRHPSQTQASFWVYASAPSSRWAPERNGVRIAPLLYVQTFGLVCFACKLSNHLWHTYPRASDIPRTSRLPKRNRNSDQESDELGRVYTHNHIFLTRPSTASTTHIQCGFPEPRRRLSIQSLRRRLNLVFVETVLRIQYLCMAASRYVAIRRG